MAESLFDIFGDHLTHQPVKNVTRIPLSNIENMGKTVISGPYKPNEPTKKSSEPKKSFLSNLGKALQSTPARQAFTPRAVNVGSMIYNDDGFRMEDVEFTKPKKNHDDHFELFEYLKPEIRVEMSPPTTPPLKSRRNSMEFDYSYQDEFFTDEFSNGSLQDDDDLGLPALY